MSDIFCSGRSTECGCPPHLCATAPVEEAPALTHSFSARDMLVVVAFGLFMFGFAWAALTQADEFYRKQALDNQEVSASWRK